MSEQSDKRRTEVPVEGEGGGEEPSGGEIPMSDEMAALMEEAVASKDTRDQAEAPGGGAASADKMTIEMLSGELTSLKEAFEVVSAERDQVKDKLIRLQAEFENFRRRSLKEKQEAARYGHQNLVKDLLSAVDNLERAIEHTEQSAGADLQNLLQGVELVLRELMGAFGKHGVSAIEAEGQPFDPALHEALAQVPTSEVPANSVVEVFQKGYQLHDRMLRPARVTVAKEPEAGGAPAGEPESAS